MTRPRTSPLLTPFTKANGDVVHLWTTFSADQVDLNFANPDALFEFLDILMFYSTQGLRILRGQSATPSLYDPQGDTCADLGRRKLGKV